MDVARISMPFLVLILVLDIAITCYHSLQEWKGEGAPLWRNFGAIVGLKIPDRWGFLIFTVALTLTMSAIGVVGIFGALGPACSTFALGMLIGARLSDTLVSHALPHLLGYRPNPGLSSTPLYVVEALFVAYAFQPRLAADPALAKAGLIAGIALFVVVLPGLWLLRFVFPSQLRTAWTRWQQMPPWASEP
ncbi:hypothetical protein IC762_24425 [Bradyrhizobium genosp. L]|uniref:hypothetical protein n=1 Tax=Bradyrhizobium genosp. L TaxID=83637 RepID=UPI0018A316C8|nr:hypothetical protein [Bradyrhizobium genosp. L]QPF82874.1 hypothetical protein IC762_24425 [Bradyrhizobium genosp. L]